MSASTVDVVRGWYAGPKPELLSEDCEWQVVETFPDGGRYVGREAIFGFLKNLRSRFDQWGASVDDVLDAGDEVVGIGSYRGTVKGSGKPFSCSFVHVWRVRDGKLSHLRQFADTLTLDRALNEG
jgi:ketosteroid isomerase-like protein